MISVCSTIYGSPKSGNAFLRSIFDNASGEDFEVILFLDRYTPEEEQTLLSNVPSSSRLTLLRGTKDDMLWTNWENIGRWRQIYGYEVAHYAANQLVRYERGEIPRLWSQYANGLNNVIPFAQGDFILLTPGDFVVLCDMHRLNAAVTEAAAKSRGRFFGHFSLVAPFKQPGVVNLAPYGKPVLAFEDVFDSVFAAFADYESVRDYLMEKHLPPSDYPVTPGIDRYWPFNHGIRVVDRKTVEEVAHEAMLFALCDDFLSKPGPTNIFNLQARAVAYGKDKARIRQSIEELTGFRARMASVPFDEDRPMEYLYENPCDGDVVRRLQESEQAWLKQIDDTFAALFKEK